MKNKGQALLEVAIFGSIIIMLLGVLISYGLRYNFQQQTMQQAFRKALKSAVVADQDGQPSLVSRVLIKDRHIPDPANPFGVGSVIPVSASASVVRNYHMQDNVPETYAELPQVTIDIQGQEASFKTAGFRDESNITEDALKKYNEIYGSSNVIETGDGECLEELPSPETGELICIKRAKNIRIIDSCAGEIINYDTAVRQCRQIVDTEACKTECERGKSLGSETDCNGICSQTMNVPWYCANYTETDSVNHAYNFPVLEQLFASSALKAMGLQQDYEQRTTTNNRLRKTENASGITTTDNINWGTETTRKIITKPYGTTDTNTAATEVKSEVGQQEVVLSETTNW